jgi:electron transport complex protein RnfB
VAVLNTRPAVPAFTAACTGCGACLLTCPTHAIRPYAGPPPRPNVGPPPHPYAGSPARVPAVLYAVESLCTACGECVEVCPVDAVQLPLNPGEEDPCPKR